MTLLTPDRISFHATISEAELRERLAQEVLESIGALDDNGKRLPGIEATVLRGDGRKGGYRVQVTGPAPARLTLPKPRKETPDV